MRAWRYLNILSLDIALGAMAGCAFFARVFDIVLMSHGWIALGLVVWIIYTVDHLADASRIAGEPSTERHRFHKRWRRPLIAIVIVASIFVAVEAFFLRKPVLYAGLGLGVLVMVYLLVQSRLKVFKELAGAALYTAGVLTVPLAMLTRPLAEGEWSLILMFGLTAFTNLLLYSWFDRANDEQDGNASMATVLGQQATGQLLIATFLVVAVIGVITLLRNPALSIPVIVMLAMNVLFYHSFQLQKFYGQEDRYRIVGDFAFLLPALYLLL